MVWASDTTFAEDVSRAIETALRRPRPGIDLAADVRAMRDLMDRERRPSGFWDLKLVPGGQVDAEFLGQFRQLQKAPTGEPLSVSTPEQLKAEPVLAESWRLHQRLAQLLACAFDEKPDPDQEPTRFRAQLAEAAAEADFATMRQRLISLRQASRTAFEQVLPAIRDGESPQPR